MSAVRLGAEDYLKKPFSFESFKLAVKRGLDRKTVFQEGGVSSFFHLIHSCQMISATMEQPKIFGILTSYFAQELGTNYCAFYSIRGNDPVIVCTNTVQRLKRIKRWKRFWILRFTQLTLS